MVAVEVPEVARAARPASMPTTRVMGTVHDRKRQKASTGPIPDWAASFVDAERNPSEAALVVEVDPEELIVSFHRLQSERA